LVGSFLNQNGLKWTKTVYNQAVGICFALTVIPQLHINLLKLLMAKRYHCVILFETVRISENSIFSCQLLLKNVIKSIKFFLNLVDLKDIQLRYF
jgi:hypothetical protein